MPFMSYWCALAWPRDRGDDERLVDQYCWLVAWK
jgi:hypothetical protein